MPWEQALPGCRSTSCGPSQRPVGYCASRGSMGSFIPVRMHLGRNARNASGWPFWHTCMLRSLLFNTLEARRLHNLAPVRSSAASIFSGHGLHQRHLVCWRGLAASAAGRASGQLVGDDTVSSLLSSLSEEQAAVVSAPADAALRVLAGPGSGKTRVLTTRVVQLIDWGLPPWKILAITFTNKAARELQIRLQDAIGEEKAKMVTSGTFHSVAQRMLRRDLPAMPENLHRGLDPNFKILDSEESVRVLKTVIKEEFKDMDSKKLLKEARMYQNQISSAKNSYAGLITCGQQLEQCYTDKVSNRADGMDMKRRLGSVFERYDAALLKNNAVDFDNLLALAVEVLRSSPEALETCRRRWPHVMVDEFQDTNGTQYEFVRLLTCESGRIFVVGDPDQAIYGWRGAQVANMVKSLEEDFSALRTMQLRDNYRSGAEICRAADAIISTGGSSLQDRTSMKSKQGTTGQAVTLLSCKDEQSEANEVARKLARLADTGTPLESCAVLFRNNSQAKVLEDALSKFRIPYVLLSGVKFWSRTEVKDLVAYLRLVVDPTDNLALLRVINVPARKIGPKTLQKMEQAAQSCGLTLAQAVLGDLLRFPSSESELDGTTMEAPDLPDASKIGASAQAHQGLASLRNVIFLARAAGLRDGGDIATVLETIIATSGYQTWMRDGKCGEGDVELRERNVEQLIGNLASFDMKMRTTGDGGQKGNMVLLEERDSWDERLDAQREGEAQNPLQKLSWFLSDVALQTDEDTEGGRGVQLMTIHASKGLEFDTVFLTGCEEGTLPLPVASEDLDALEEERRVFFVGVTRAKHRLFLSLAAYRRRWGAEFSFNSEPSRFVLDMEKELAGTAHPLKVVKIPHAHRRGSVGAGSASRVQQMRNPHAHSSSEQGSPSLSVDSHTQDSIHHTSGNLGQKQRKRLERSHGRHVGLAFGQDTRQAFESQPTQPRHRHMSTATRASLTNASCCESESSTDHETGIVPCQSEKSHTGDLTVGGRRQRRASPIRSRAGKAMSLKSVTSSTLSKKTPGSRDVDPLCITEKDQTGSGNSLSPSQACTFDSDVKQHVNASRTPSQELAGRKTPEAAEHSSPEGISAGWIALLTGKIPAVPNSPTSEQTSNLEPRLPISSNESKSTRRAQGAMDKQRRQTAKDSPPSLSLGHHIGVVLSRRVESDREGNSNTSEL